MRGLIELATIGLAPSVHAIRGHDGFLLNVRRARAHVHL